MQGNSRGKRILPWAKGGMPPQLQFDAFGPRKSSSQKHQLFASLCGICGIETGEFQLVLVGSFWNPPKLQTVSLWNGSTQGLSHVIQSAAPQFVQVVETELLNVPWISRHPTLEKTLPGWRWDSWDQGRCECLSDLRGRSKKDHHWGVRVRVSE